MKGDVWCNVVCVWGKGEIVGFDVFGNKIMSFVFWDGYFEEVEGMIFLYFGIFICFFSLVWMIWEEFSIG